LLLLNPLLLNALTPSVGSKPSNKDSSNNKLNAVSPPVAYLLLAPFPIPTTPSVPVEFLRILENVGKDGMRGEALPSVAAPVMAVPSLKVRREDQLSIIFTIFLTKMMRISQLF
jgi:hypothetical protein